MRALYKKRAAGIRTLEQEFSWQGSAPRTPGSPGLHDILMPLDGAEGHSFLLAILYKVQAVKWHFSQPVHVSTTALLTSEILKFV